MSNEINNITKRIQEIVGTEDSSISAKNLINTFLSQGHTLDEIANKSQDELISLVKLECDNSNEMYRDARELYGLTYTHYPFSISYPECVQILTYNPKNTIHENLNNEKYYLQFALNDYENIKNRLNTIFSAYDDNFYYNKNIVLAVLLDYIYKNKEDSGIKMYTYENQNKSDGDFVLEYRGKTMTGKLSTFYNLNEYFKDLITVKQKTNNDEKLNQQNDRDEKKGIKHKQDNKELKHLASLGIDKISRVFDNNYSDGQHGIKNSENLNLYPEITPEIGVLMQTLNNLMDGITNRFSHPNNYRFSTYVKERLDILNQMKDIISKHNSSPIPITQVIEKIGDNYTRRLENLSYNLDQEKMNHAEDMINQYEELLDMLGDAGRAVKSTKKRATIQFIYGRFEGFKFPISWDLLEKKFIKNSTVCFENIKKHLSRFTAINAIADDEKRNRVINRTESFIEEVDFSQKQSIDDFNLYILYLNEYLDEHKEENAENMPRNEFKDRAFKKHKQLNKSRIPTPRGTIISFFSSKNFILWGISIASSRLSFSAKQYYYTSGNFNLP